jgi:SAM-dependent methyltransferase
VVAQEPVRLPVPAALLGRGAASIHHARAIARSARSATGRDGARGRPGDRYYSRDVAGWIQPGGTLHALDLQQEMLDHTMRRAREARIANLEPRLGDARELPYADAKFDGIFLVAVLGEVPDQDRALGELRRVLKPTGRIVIGELAGDPHMVSAGALRARAKRAGLAFERRVGPPFGYFGILRRDGD